MGAWLIVVTEDGWRWEPARPGRKRDDTGEMRVLGSEPGSARALWSGCTGFDENMWHEVLGSVEELLRMSGAQDVRVRVRAGGHDGDASLELEATWR